MISLALTASLLISTTSVVLGFFAGALACLCLTVIEWGAWSLVMPGRKRPKPLPDDLPAQPIQTLAPDGTRLSGVWFPADEGQGATVVLLHGLAEDHAALLGRVAPLLRVGWNVATLDSRASGESHGRRSTFSAYESTDLSAWLDTLTPLAGPAPRFVAWGRSMGASIALRTASHDPRLAALILEAPYCDLHPAVTSVVRRLRIPFAPWLARGILIRARSLAGVSLDQPRPTDFAHQLNRPILILHGEQDKVAPLADARTLAQAFPNPAEIYEVPGAGHANVVGEGGEPLWQRVITFLELNRTPA